MIASIIAALMLQASASDPIAAHCRLDNSTYDPCNVIVASDVTTGEVGVGFLVGTDAVLVSGPQVSTNRFKVSRLDFGDVSNIPVLDGSYCDVVRRNITCKVRTPVLNFTIEAISQ